MTPRGLKALVTAGGTREAIDDVRVVTNLSSGRFGTAIATALSNLGVETTLAGSHLVAERHKLGLLDPRLHFQAFHSFQSLFSILEEAVTEHFDLIFMAAAVSDFSPTKHQGKMSSKPQEISITMVRNPKILARLREWHQDTVLVGFKLLSNVSQQELISVAKKQIEKNQLDWTVANDLRELGGQDHPIFLVPKESKPERIEGRRSSVAERLCQHILENSNFADRSERFPKPEFFSDLDLIEPQDILSSCTTEPDEPVHKRLFSALPNLHTILQSNKAIALTDFHAETDLHSPELLARELHQGNYGGASFAIELAHQSLIGLCGREWQEWPQQREQTFEEWSQSLENHSAGENWQELRPILGDGQWLGFLAINSQQQAMPFLRKSVRGKGWGDRLVEWLDARDWSIAWPKDLDPAYFIARGYGLVEQLEHLNILEAPSHRQNARTAASICLINPLRKKVLLGKRLVPPWKGYWAFPGGNADKDETKLQAAKRELFEETAIEAPDSEPIAQRVVYVASGKNGERFYEVTNYQFLTLELQEPKITKELEARWWDLDDVANIKPMAAGTRRILCHALRTFGHHTARRAFGAR